MLGNKIIVRAVKKPTIIQESEYAFLLDHIPSVIREKIERFMRKEDSYRSLIGDIILRVTIGAILDCRIQDITLKKNKYGKPFLVHDSNFHFNISHSGDWIVCGFDDKPIGIDVEKMKSPNLDIAERFFSPREHNDLLAKAELTEKRSYFYDLWTLKESYIKALGMGLSRGLSTFSIVFNDRKPHVEDYLEKSNGHIYHFKQYFIDASHKIAVCAQHNTFPDEAEIMSFSDLFFLFEDYVT